MVMAIIFSPKFLRSWGGLPGDLDGSHFDSELSKWPLVKQSGFCQHHPRPCHALILVPRMGYVVHFRLPDSWAYRWAFTCVVERGLTAIPKVNLIENIGFDLMLLIRSIHLLCVHPNPPDLHLSKILLLSLQFLPMIWLFLIFTLTANGCAFLFPLQRYF